VHICCGVETAKALDAGKQSARHGQEEPPAELRTVMEMVLKSSFQVPATRRRSAVASVAGCSASSRAM